MLLNILRARESYMLTGAVELNPAELSEKTCWS